MCLQKLIKSAAHAATAQGVLLPDIPHQSSLRQSSSLSAAGRTPCNFIILAKLSARVSHAHYSDIHTNSSEAEKEMISVAEEVAPTPIIYS